jgi:hypothetical protein
MGGAPLFPPGFLPPRALASLGTAPAGPPTLDFALQSRETRAVLNEPESTARGTDGGNGSGERFHGYGFLLVR